MILSCKYSKTDQAIANPSNVDVPLPISSRITKDFFVDVFKIGNADAALAASVFHFKEIEIKNLKEELIKNNIKVRL